MSLGSIATLSINDKLTLPINNKPTLPVIVDNDIEPIENKIDAIDCDKLYNSWQQHKINNLNQLDMANQFDKLAITNAIEQAKELEHKLQQCLIPNVNYIDEILAYRMSLEDYINIGYQQQPPLENNNYKNLLNIAMDKLGLNFNKAGHTVIVNNINNQVTTIEQNGPNNVYQAAARQFSAAGFQVNITCTLC